MREQCVSVRTSGVLSSYADVVASVDGRASVVHKVCRSGHALSFGHRQTIVLVVVFSASRERGAGKVVHAGEGKEDRG